MRSWLTRHRIFLVLWITSVVLVGLLAGAFALFGDEILRADYERDALGILRGLLDQNARLEWDQGRKPPFEKLAGPVRERFTGFLTLAVSALVLAPLAWFAATSRRRRVAFPCALIVWWLAVETFAPPFLLRILPLEHYVLIRDVDHWRQADGATDERRLRDTPPASAFLPEHLNVIFLGDSFTYGYRLRPEQTFVRGVADALREALPDETVNVANFGWVSSSPLLSLRRLQRIGADYSPDLVVLCLDMSDFHDDLRYANMLEKRGLYRFYERLPLTIKLFETVAPELYLDLLFASVGGSPRDRFFMTSAPLEATREWMRPLATNVGLIHEWCRRRDAEFVLIVLPRGYQYSDRESPGSWEADRYTPLGPHVLEPFRFFEELQPAVDYPIVSLLADFQHSEVFPTCFRNDPHWNEAGAQVAMSAMTRALLPIAAARLAR